MNTFTKALLITGLVSLSACEKKSTEQAAAITTCPAENVLTDISSYSTETADPTLDQDAFFAANGELPGVVTTPSGLQYRVNKSGPSASAHPEPSQTVRIHYHGQFLDGKTFDSSYDRGEPLEYSLNKFIKGWVEGVGMMRPCDAWTFYIPSDLAYGDSGSGPIPPSTPLMFHVQLIGVQ